MLDSIFHGLFDTEMTQIISITDFLLCVASALVIGLILAFAYMIRSRYTRALSSRWRCCLRWFAW